MREINFDGLVGPTHNYGGLSLGNVASARSEGRTSSPRAAALQGIAKMRFVHGLGVEQAVLPPPLRPSLRTLRALGFRGPDEEILASVATSTDGEHLLRLCSSSSAMWAANAATIAPSSDTADGRVHIVPANLQTMFHRAIETETTHALLERLFADERRFAVHAPLPGGGQLADEGAANHTRLETPGHEAVHVLAWGKRAWVDGVDGGDEAAPAKYPARQTLEASSTLARVLQLDPKRSLLPQQHPRGIDEGSFHTDVLAVGHRNFLMAHELAFADRPTLYADLQRLLGDALTIATVSSHELPVADAVAAYPFNSQLVEVPDGTLAIIAPVEARENARARAFLDSVVAGDNPVRALHFIDVRQSMDNGGGPACLRLRVPLTAEERASVHGDVFFTDTLGADLEAWVNAHYRDRLAPKDLADPQLYREIMTALDELAARLGLGDFYDFQR
jgi:succinylarginine dihydrolase